jgi:hypothetical protein
MTSFTEFDIKLLSILNKLWDDHFEKIVRKSLEYTINITPENMSGDSIETEVIHEGEKTNKKIIMFGMYDKKKEIFVWNRNININKKFYNLIVNDAPKAFGTMETIDKFFEDEVQISNKFYHAIPALIGMYFLNYNVIKFINEDKTHIFFALVKFEFDNKFDYNTFFKSIHKYYTKDQIVKS